MLPSNKQQIIEQAKLTCSPLEKAFEKQITTIEGQEEKQVKALNTLNLIITIEDGIPKSVFANDEAKEEFNKIKKQDKMQTEKKYSINKKNKYKFKNFQTIRTFGEDIYNGEITLEEADKDQSNLLEKNNDFIKKTRPRSDNKRQEKKC